MPSNNILETTLIGTGGGYGESIVLHLGNQNWIVVDSCVDPKTNNSLPLEYLKSIGVKVEKDVKLIICTHWHDDHILGISKLFEAAKNAVLSITKTSDRKKFLQLVELDYHKVESNSSISSTIELKNCISIANNRRGTIKTASEDRVLFSSNNSKIKIEVISLSPSDFVVHEFNEEISTLMKDFGNPNKKIVFNTPNDKSVVILVKINDHRILLGSDLEVTDDPRKGWLCILNKSQCIDAKSTIFKIPHHGSSTGYHKRIWDELIAENAIAKLTPWNRGNKLPKKDMLEKYLNHTPRLYSTSLNLNNKSKPRKRDRSLAKAINKFNSSLIEIKYHLGIVKCSANLNTQNVIWKVNLHDEAIQITANNIQKL